MYLFFETGMRIGEALSLWLEDFEISECRIRIVDRGEDGHYITPYIFWYTFLGMLSSADLGAGATS